MNENLMIIGIVIGAMVLITGAPLLLIHLVNQAPVWTPIDFKDIVPGQRLLCKAGDGKSSIEVCYGSFEYEGRTVIAHLAKLDTGFWFDYPLELSCIKDCEIKVLTER